MSHRLALAPLLIYLSALCCGRSSAQETLALDTYICAQFIQDSSEAGHGTNVIRSLMMISWATGYAAAFQEKNTRADASAILLIAGTLGDVCRKEPASRAVTAFAKTLSQFAATTSPTKQVKRKRRR